MTTVKQLKIKLDALPDDLEVVIATQLGDEEKAAEFDSISVSYWHSDSDRLHVAPWIGSIRVVVLIPKSFVA